MKKLIIVSLYVYLTCGILYAHGDHMSDNLKIAGYSETYYAYDVGNPSNHTRPAFVYSHNRTNEMNLKLGYVKLAYTTAEIRTNLALMVGTYGNANISAERGVLKNIYEANVGIKIAEKKNIWLDAGISSLHIGYESAVSKDCWILTRSILAENSPYFETGVKITSISDKEKWVASALLLNGWQRMQRVDGSNMPAFLYAVLQLSQEFGLILGLNMGAQQISKGSNSLAISV